MVEISVSDVKKAQLAAEKHLKIQYGANKIQDIKYSKVAHLIGAIKDVWEVEGEAIIKTGKFERNTMRFRRSIIHFKFQIDPINSNLIGFIV